MRSTKAASETSQSPRRAAKSNGSVRRATPGVKEQAVQKVSEVAEKIKAQGEGFLAEQKERAAAELDGIGQSIRRSASSLQEGPLGDLSGYVEAAADRIDRASRYLVEQDLQALRRDAEGVALRQPTVFLGGMFLLGLGLARFLKASAAAAPDRSDEDDDEPVRRRQRQRQTNTGRRRAGK